jgi:transposase
MGKYYSVEFRQKVVNAYENGEGSYREIGQRFSIGEASVNRWVALERYTGSVAPKAQGRRTGPTKATPDVVALILRLVNDESTVTSTQLAESVARELSIQLCQQTVCRILKDAGYTSKRGSYVRQPTELSEL